MGTQLLTVFLSKLPKLSYPILLISPHPGNSAGSILSLPITRPTGIFSQTLSADSAWLIEWSVAIEAGGTHDDRNVFAAVYEHKWGSIVPWHVVEYLNGGILLYKQKAFATALALMSIAVEATLRDVLSTRCYTFRPGTSKVHIYGYSPARVDADGPSYRLTFLDTMPKSPADLPASVGDASTVNVEIRRTINQTKNRVDLLIKAPPYLVDHWSQDQVIQPGQPKSISGLGEALCIARNKENIVTPSDLPTDVDEVLKAVRNNLVHLSSQAMDVELRRFASLSDTGEFTVRDFINNPALVFDLIADIPRFINEQYVKLWKAGKHV